MKYRQITSGERYAISALRRRGLSMRQIASELGRAHTTISREIRRNSCSDGGYRPFKASHRTRGRRSRSRRNARITPEQWAVVDRYLRADSAEIAHLFQCKPHTVPVEAEQGGPRRRVVDIRVT